MLGELHAGAAAPSQSLAGKRVVVTGASSGIGRAVVAQCVRAGAHIVLVGRDPIRLAAVAPVTARQAGEQLVLEADLMDDSAIADVVQATISAFGAVDGVVHSAGIWRRGAFSEAPVDDLDDQWRLNVRQPYLLTRSLLPHLRSGSSLVFISSAAGQVGVPNMAGYCATKGAVEQLTRALAAELGPRGIRVNCVAPGSIDTPMTANALANPEYRDAATAAAPLGRLGLASEVASVIRFLLDDASGFIHGETISVDGGVTAI